MTVTVEQGVRALALGSAAVAALIVDRFGPHQQSQMTLRPYVVSSRVAADHQEHLGGGSGLVYARIQLDCYADDEDTLAALVEALRLRLHGYRGTVTVGSGSLDIQSLQIVDELSDAERPNDGSDSGPQHHRMDLRVCALEPIPTLT